jgi:hypothetical protein
MQVHFQGIVLFIFLYTMLDLHQKQLHHWKELKMIKNQHGYFAFNFTLYAIPALEEHGDTYNRFNILILFRTLKLDFVNVLVCPLVPGSAER